MCGIVGCTGNQSVTPILVESLKRLEYRGYDSAGIATLNGAEIDVTKIEGKISELESILNFNNNACVGIGHTRWATHGVPSSTNAHPHVDCSGSVAVVHNGIIENFQALKEELKGRGHIFSSETDTEVIAHLIEETYNGDLECAVRDALSRVDGSYAIAVISDNEPDVIVAARKDSPLVVGLGDGENFVASDIPALRKFTNKVIYVNDGEIVRLTRNNVTVSTLDGLSVEKSVVIASGSVQDAERGGYEHFMLKEIHEQPKALRETMEDRLYELEGNVDFKELRAIEHAIEDIESISIIACGTSYHAGILGKYMLEDLVRIPVRVEYSSEFRYNNPLPGNKSLAICISQSGETADTLAAMNEARSQGYLTLAVTNVDGSTITRKADEILLTRSGTEIGVAATKTFTAQLLTLYMLGVYIARMKTLIDVETSRYMISSLKAVPGLIESLLDDINNIEKCALQVCEADCCYFIGRGLNYPIALEGALKMKEISYIRAEGFPAGELKHGPLALITTGTPVIALVPKGKTYYKMLGNIKEVKARNANVTAVANNSDDEIPKYVDSVIRIPDIDELFSPMLTAVVLQLLAYYTAKFKGAEIDQPRNLAKSVTVE
ncbi:MAG: glutamine--fructose-6-phosphate transaminase (isomerizing) [Euryarchaeota archaeon]|nr:glutamine--fructose-6-phosphate transaminase (isomerizing) [Euryarchaeota archaeon]